jgi:hypothetical protein
MKTILTKGLSKERAVELESDFKAAAFFRERLAATLEDKVNTLRKEVRQKNQYDSPSWALTQADYIGFERAIYEIISLISNDSVEKVTKTK